LRKRRKKKLKSRNSHALNGLMRKAGAHKKKKDKRIKNKLIKLLNEELNNI